MNQRHLDEWIGIEYSIVIDRRELASMGYRAEIRQYQTIKAAPTFGRFGPEPVAVLLYKAVRHAGGQAD
jgi:hypothetical protein